MAWQCPLPDGFVDLLDNDIERLARDVAERAAVLHGKVIKVERVMVDGWPGLLRIVRLPGGGFPAAVYVAGVVVPVGEDEGFEVTVTCGGLGELLKGPPATVRRG